MLPVAWSIYDSPFSWLCLSGLTYKHITLFHLSRDKKISCRTENNNCHVGGLQEYCDQTYMNSCKNKGFLHQEICNKQPYPSSFSIKEAWIFLTLVRCFFGARVHYLLGLMAFQISCYSLVTQTVKSLPVIQKTWVPSLGQKDPLEKGMPTHSSVLAWRIPWIKKLGSLQSMGSQRVGHNWVTNTFTFFHQVSMLG